LTEWNVSFLASVSRILLRLGTADELMGIVSAKIGAYLNLSRCALIEIGEGADEAVVTHDWQQQPGMSIRGVYRISDSVTEQFLEAAHAGEALVVRDLATATTPRAEPEELAALRIASFVCVPILPDGQLRFALFVCPFRAVRLARGRSRPRARTRRADLDSTERARARRERCASRRRAIAVCSIRLMKAFASSR
jgi:hypothetical protein